MLNNVRSFYCLYINLIKNRFLLSKNSMEIQNRIIDTKNSNDTELEESLSKRRKLNKEEQTERGKKKKYVFLMSYIGKNYYGMQIIKNNPLPTIEEELFDAMIKSSLIEEKAKECPQNIRFQRAARTDKGVSAIRQIVSLKLRVQPEINIAKLVNEYLPDCIRILGTLKVTKNFDAKNFCDFRTYSYTAPTFAFSPNTEKSDESYRITPKVLSRLDEILKLYLGTHSFHNFTSRVKSTEERAKRYIMEVGIDGPFIMDGLEFIRIKIRGQSFMMHQIRKMVAFAMGICKGVATTENLLKAFQYKYADIPIAPGLGLVLEEPHFEVYNKKFSSDGIHESITWDPYKEEIEEFRNKYINKNIVETEKKEHVTLTWLQNLSHHSFTEDIKIKEVSEDINISYSILKRAISDDEDVQNNSSNESLK